MSEMLRTPVATLTLVGVLGTAALMGGCDTTDKSTGLDRSNHHPNAAGVYTLDLQGGDVLPDTLPRAVRYKLPNVVRLDAHNDTDSMVISGVRISDNEIITVGHGLIAQNTQKALFDCSSDTVSAATERPNEKNGKTGATVDIKHIQGVHKKDEDIALVTMEDGAADILDLPSKMVIRDLKRDRLELFDPVYLAGFGRDGENKLGNPDQSKLSPDEAAAGRDKPGIIGGIAIDEFTVLTNLRSYNFSLGASPQVKHSYSGGYVEDKESRLLGVIKAAVSNPDNSGKVHLSRDYLRDTFHVELDNAPEDYKPNAIKFQPVTPELIAQLRKQKPVTC